MQKDDVVMVLKAMISDELSKADEEVNTDLVDECVDALLEIEKERDRGFAIVIPLMSANDYLDKINGNKHGFKSLNIFARAAVVAAILAATSVSANAAIESATGISIFERIGNAIQERLSGSEDEKELSQSFIVPPFHPPHSETHKHTATKQATTYITSTEKPAETVATTQEETTESNEETEVTTVPAQTTEKEKTTVTETSPSTEKATVTRRIEPTTSSGSDNGEDETVPELVALDAVLSGFKKSYIYGEELSYDGLTLIATYSDGSEKEIPLSDTRYTKSLNMNVTADYTLKIVYKGFTVTIDITVRPDEDTRGGEKKENELFEYMLTENGAYVTRYKGTDTTVDASETDGYPIFAIGASVFENSNVTSVYAPNAIKIFENAFKNASALEVCTTPNAEYIENEAFKNTSSLKKAQFNAESCTLGEGVYSNSGIESITIPEGSEVPKALCEECESLKTVNLNGSRIVGERAFNSCPLLETVNGAGNIKEVGSFAFYADELAVLDEAPVLEKVSDNAFAYCKKMNLGDITEALEEIGDYAFMYCTKIKRATLSEKITTIPVGAFWGTHLVSLTLPEGLSKIGDAAFMSTALTKVTIPKGVDKIGSRAFDTATLLKVYFDGSPGKIEESAFFKSTRLTFYAYHNTTPAEFAIYYDIKLEYLDELPYNMDIIIGEDD